MAVFDSLLSRIAQQDQRIVALEARLKLNSTNSSQAPSSDPIGLKAQAARTALQAEIRRTTVDRGQELSHFRGQN